VSEGLIAIAKRIRREISELDKIREHALRRWQKVSKDQDYLGSVGFDLQSFYQGVERVFQTIAKSIDRSVPAGEKWHKTLLEQMANEVSGIPPAVISTQAREALDNFRMFRHLAHNIYTFNLDPRRIKSLVDDLPGTVDLTCHDLLHFAEFLEQSTSTQDLV
jgi:HepT-like protein